MIPAAPSSTSNLLPAERRLLSMMRQLGHGRIERLQINDGVPVFEPELRIVKTIKFGSERPAREEAAAATFTLKKQVVELFVRLRGLKAATVRRIEVHDGLPVLMEIEEGPHA
jgi:hypothetical protein